MGERSPKEILEEHWALAEAGNLEEDVARNYADDVVFLTGFGTYHGHDGARALHRRLAERVPDLRLIYRTRLVHGDIGFLEWTAQGRDTVIPDGADTYLVRDGRIVVQTIHYTTVPASRGVAGPGPAFDPTIAADLADPTHPGPGDSEGSRPE
ncbi:MAG TPA: nuclear transport factor 2 family protein [Actinomycetota bacterium]|nr:nuclear transport factor 2 family protein [Actinomycetota bacterium]